MLYEVITWSSECFQKRGYSTVEEYQVQQKSGARRWAMIRVTEEAMLKAGTPMFSSRVRVSYNFV